MGLAGFGAWSWVRQSPEASTAGNVERSPEAPARFARQERALRPTPLDDLATGDVQPAAPEAVSAPPSPALEDPATEDLATEDLAIEPRLAAERERTSRPAARAVIEGSGRDEAPPSPPAAEEASATHSRSLDAASFQIRRQPGLCNDPGDAIEARQALMRRFHQLDWDGEPLLFVDPRVPADASAALLPLLADAERRAGSALRLEVPRPEVFAYFDSELLLAAACTNDDVVAYYDGALHVVATHADVGQSVVHEYTHHVLMSSGIFGPTWAQEGIAMNVALERWWQQPGWLNRVLTSPFSLDAMERATPYTMRSDEAVLFYVQSAAMVTCATRGEQHGVADLVRALFGERPRDALAYELPEPADPVAWGECVRSLLR